MAVFNFQKPDKVIMIDSSEFEGKFEFRPLEFFNLIFSRSSIKPKKPNPMETKITVKMYTLLRSAHKKVPKKIPNIIIRPPIVGVPDFFII